MAVLKGIDVIVQVDVSGVPTTIAGQKNATLSLSSDTIDTTSKDTAESNGDWRTFLSGIKSWTLSCDGLYVDGDPALDELQTKFEAGEAVSLTMSQSGAWTATGNAIITSLDYDASLEDAMTVSAEFQGTGAITIN
ncbi:MAG: phage major tail protein, TP901-1 family [Candidatus Freyarchaeota archaeon]